MPDRQPADIARETLRQLALRRLSPTPDNYTALYDEIAGTRSPAAFPAGPLQHILRVLPGQTPAQKRLLEQFQRAVAQNDWSAVQNVLVGYAHLGLHPVDTVPALPAAQELRTLPTDLAEALARLIDHLLPALGEDDARVHDLAQELMGFLRDTAPPASTVQRMLANFTYRLSFTTDDQAVIRSSLLQLLHTVFENIAALSVDNPWLHTQVEALVAASTPPLSRRRLEEVQRRLKDVIFKQTEAKARTVEAQAVMKDMLAAFLERLAQITASSSSYQDTMARCADLIGQARTLEEITPALHEALNATRTMALDSRMVHGELEELRTHAVQKQAEISQLQQALDRTSAQMRHDPLTGALNRKGLEEALEREIARTRRLGSPLSLVLMDIDAFQALQEHRGAPLGEAALRHLTEVTQNALRAQDLLARYGAEAFVLVLPDTPANDALAAVQRLQRELTTRLFLEGSEQVLITFSAGVAELRTDETPTEALLRADHAMRQAQRSGRNRALAA